MRIGIISGEFPPMQGGVGAYTRILAENLNEQGQEVSVFSTQAASYDHAAIPLERSLARWDWRSLGAVRQWARRQTLDLVSLQYQTAAYNMSPWIHLLPDALRPLPFVTTFHDLRPPYWFPKAGRLRHWLVKRLAQASTGVIATNHEDFAQLSALSSVLIPIGSNIVSSVDVSDQAELQRLRLDLGYDINSFLIAFFGLVNRSKGLHTLVDALAGLRERGCPARVIVVGGTVGSSDPSNLDYAKTIERQIASLGLSSAVQFTGYLDDDTVGRYLAAADCIALPFEDGASFRRGSLMAALRYGMAIVTTPPCTEIAEFVDGKNLLSVPPADANALADALWLLWQQPDLRATLKRGAAALAPAFEWDAIARAHIQFFQQVLETSRDQTAP